MSDIDVVEKVLTDQPDLPVHIPYAGNTSPGIASFNTRDFIVEENGAVQLSKDVQALTEEAVQAADNAKQSEQNAANSETNAKQSASKAAVSETNAKSSETNAKSSEKQAQTYLQQVQAAEIRINNTEDNVEQIAEQVSTDRIEVENLKSEFTEYVTYVESQASLAAEMASDALAYSSNANTYKQEAQQAWLQARSEADRAQQISDSIGATFKPKGTIKFEELPAQPSAEYEGFLWDISNSFMTDGRFIVGAGQYVPAGSDVSCIETTDGVYKYNISAGLYDLSAYVTKTQLDLETEAREAADNNLSTRIDAKYTKPSSGIPDTDLSTDVKDSLGKADTAYQKPSSGIPESDLASAVQTSLSKADSALQSIPIATASAVGGVKPAAKTSEMTQAVGVDSNGALWTKEASEGTTVVANPTATGTQDLTSLQVGGTVYNIPQGGGGITQSTVIERPESLPTATADSPDFVEVGGVLYRKKAVEGGANQLSGTWVWNDEPAPKNPAITQNINFTSNGQSFTSIKATFYHSIIGDVVEIYYNSTLYCNGDSGYWGWDSSENYKTIDFGTQPQTVAEDFYTYFTANATQTSGGGGASVSYEYVAQQDIPTPTVADNGKVLGVANGAYALQAASGGGGNKYAHNIYFINANDGGYTYKNLITTIILEKKEALTDSEIYKILGMSGSQSQTYLTVLFSGAYNNDYPSVKNAICRTSMDSNGNPVTYYYDTYADTESAVAGGSDAHDFFFDEVVDLSTLGIS